jgi:hypothetical protein
MEFIERDDGIVVPKQPPQPPGREYGALEIRDETQREQAHKAMGMLWRAMGLHNPSAIRLPDEVKDFDGVYRLYRYFGEAILGADCPDFEQLC